MTIKRTIEGGPVKLVALHAFTHEGIAYTEGQKFTIAPAHAAALTYQRKARFADRSPAPAVGVPSPSGEERRAVAEGRRPRGQTRKESTDERRDLTAETPDTETE